MGGPGTGEHGAPWHPAATKEGAPMPGVTARSYCSLGINEAAWEKGVN